MIKRAAILALSLIAPSLANAGSWDRTAIIGEYGGYYENLPSYVYRSAHFRPGEFATITIQVPTGMPDWARAPRPKAAKERQRFYSEIGFNNRNVGPLSKKARAMVQYCTQQKFAQLVDLGECMYMTAQANMTVVVNLAFDARKEGSFENAAPAFYNSTSNTTLTMRAANSADIWNERRYTYISRSVSGKPAFRATTYCDYELGDTEEFRLSRRLCAGDRSEGAASASHGHIHLTLASIKHYRKDFDAIGIRFWSSDSSTNIAYIRFDDVLERLAPWLK